MKKIYIEFEAINEDGYGFYVTLQKNEIVAYAEIEEEYFDEYKASWKSAQCTEVITRNEAVYSANVNYDKFRKMMR